jgi:transmembrane sensor
MRAWAWRTAAGLAAAAAAAVVAFVAVNSTSPVREDVYQTARGETRTLNLADGSRIDLGSASRLSVRLGPKLRHVELVDGEAAFDVTRDAARPFLIAAGERDIRVVGTAFDVLRHDGRLRVTVLRGVVAVQPPQGSTAAAPVLLKVGDQYQHDSGQSLSSVRRVDPEDAFAWRRGELVYMDQPLEEVVSDLSRYFSTPLRVIGPAGRLRFSGVLKIDAEEKVVRRLQGFLHITAEHGPDGYILRMREPQG